MRKKTKVGKGFSLKLLMWLCAIWYFIQMGIVAIEFLRPEIQIPLFVRTIVFVFLLSLYALKHEQARWMKRLSQRGKGEWFVLGWCLFTLFMLLGWFFGHDKYPFPWRAIENLVFIVSVFCGTRISKIYYRIKTHGRRFVRYYALRVFLGVRGSKLVCWLNRFFKKLGRIFRKPKKPLVFHRKGTDHETATFSKAA